MHRLLLALVAALLAGPAAADCVMAFADLPVTMAGTRPIIHIGINGRDEPILADSGAFFNFLTPGSAAELGLKQVPAPFGFMITGVGGAASASVATVKQLTIAGVAIANADFLVGGSEIGEGAIGAIGQNVLGRFDVEYDLAGGMIRLARPKGCGNRPLAYWAKDNRFSEMEIGETDVRSPQTKGEAKVNGRPIRVMFDTGAATSFLSLGAARRAGIQPDGPGVVPAGMSRGIGRKLVRTWIAPVDSFVIAGEQINHTRLRIGDTDLLDVDMLLGADLFLSHRVYVASSQHKLYFTYNGGPVFNLAAKPEAQSAAGPAPAPAEEPKDAEAFSRRGAALAARREFDAAIADFTRAIDMAPTEPRYFTQRALARLAMKQPVLAMGDLDQALKLKPGDAGALIARAELRLAAHDPKDAVADLDAAAAASAREADARFTLAELYLRADAFPAAIDQFELWIKAHPDDSRRPVALGGRCWARAMSGAEIAVGMADCEAAVKAGPKNPGPLAGRGLARVKTGHAPEGTADLAAAAALDPKLPAEAKARGLAP